MRRSAARNSRSKECAQPTGSSGGATRRNLPPRLLLYAYTLEFMPVRLGKDEELDKLEEDIRILKTRYDQFFMGIQKFPPSFERKQIETYIYELGKQKMRDNGRRFRYSQLLTRYNQLRELWGRKMREREEGPLDFRRRSALLNEPVAPLPPPPRVTSPKLDPYVKVASGTNGEEIKRL